VVVNLGVKVSNISNSSSSLTAIGGGGVECDWDRIQSCWFQHGGVENQVYSVETVWKL